MSGPAASVDRAASAPGGPALEVRNLTVHYGDLLALDDVSLSLRRGTICGLIGMNGSGKSTLFKAIMGTVKPDRGSVAIAGLAPKQARRAAAAPRGRARRRARCRRPRPARGAAR